MKRICLVCICTVMLMSAKTMMAENWQTVYQTDFSSEPGWTTNNSSNYYWDSASGTYYQREIDQSEEYSYKLLPSLQAGQSWRLEYDIKPDLSYSGAANARLSFTQSGMNINESGAYITLDFVPDSNPMLLWKDSQGYSSYEEFHPTVYSLDIWYHGLVEWNPAAGTLSARITVKDTGESLGENIASGIGSFDGIDRLAMSTVGDNLMGTGISYIDNIVVSQTPEPASLLLLGLGSLALRRGRK